MEWESAPRYRTLNTPRLTTMRVRVCIRASAVHCRGDALVVYRPSSPSSLLKFGILVAAIRTSQSGEFYIGGVKLIAVVVVVVHDAFM